MKFFTPSMFGMDAGPEASVAEYLSARDRYADYLQSISRTCALGVRRFISLNLHDAQFNSALLGTDHVFSCELDCSPTGQVTPKYVRLTFHCASNWQGSLPQRRDEWLYEELQMAGPDEFYLTLVFFRTNPGLQRFLCSWQFSALDVVAI
jgi:hypothetical protein